MYLDSGSLILEYSLETGLIIRTRPNIVSLDGLPSSWEQGFLVRY